MHDCECMCIYSSGGNRLLENETESPSLAGGSLAVQHISGRMQTCAVN